LLPKNLDKFLFAIDSGFCMMPLMDSDKVLSSIRFRPSVGDNQQMRFCAKID